MKKPISCKRCLKDGHYTYQCFLNRTPIKKGKKTKVWDKERLQLAKDTPPDHAGYWYCHYCGIALTKHTLTWDHMHGRDGDLLTDRQYIVPCCGSDNSLKGSRSYESFCTQYYPHLLKK